jgi:hypothetical protein
LGVITKSFINGFAKRHRTYLLCLTKLKGKTKGQADPWVISLGISHFDFLGLIHFLGFIYFEISIISRILCILMFLIIAFRKSFMNVALVFFLELFGQEHKFGT